MTSQVNLKLSLIIVPAMISGPGNNDNYMIMEDFSNMIDTHSFNLLQTFITHTDMLPLGYDGL